MNIDDPTVHGVMLGGITHLTRAPITGCTTECGIRLPHGAPTFQGRKRGIVCSRCRDQIENHMVYQPGLRA